MIPEFQPLIIQILCYAPEERLILLFSATFPITGNPPTHFSLLPLLHYPPPTFALFLLQ